MSIGIVSNQNALKLGPAAPVSGLVAMASPLLIVVLAVID